MSGIEQQIEDACLRIAKEACRVGVEAGIAIGRKQALAELYVEVKPEDVKPDTTYVFVRNGVAEQRCIVLVELLQFVAKESDKIYRLNLPSPSAVFGGGA